MLALLLVSPPAVFAADDPELGDGSIARTPDPSWETEAALIGRRYSIRNDQPGPAFDGAAEGFDITVLGFRTPLRDDGAPYSLQPFLQRTSLWTVAFDSGHIATHNPFGGDDPTTWNVGAGATFDVYVRRWLAVTGSLAYGFSAFRNTGNDHIDHVLSGSVGFGLRIADTRLDAGYGLAKQDLGGSFAPLRQSFGLSLFSAIARRATIALSGALVPGGGDGSASVEYFPERELGIFMSAFAAKSRSDPQGFDVRGYGGTAGVGGWFDSTAGIVARYRLDIEDVSSQPFNELATHYHEVSHAITLQVNTRFP